MNAASFLPVRSLCLAGLTSALVASLVACGGGGSSATSTGADGAATSSTETYTGTVSGLGSIVVNGVRFSTTTAVTVDGDDPSVSYTKSFALGTTVIVKGSVDSSAGTGQATSIEIVGGVRGKVGSVDLSAQTLTVSGQTIHVTDQTVFDGGSSTPFDLASIAASLASSTAVYVEVFGLPDANNVIQATRIEKKDPAGMVFALKGYIVAGTVDTTAKTFNMLLRRGLTMPRTVTVHYADATVLPNGVTPADGFGVRVLADVDPTNLTDITAKKVLIKPTQELDGALAKIRGVVASIDGTTWTIGNTTIDVSKSPKLKGITSISDVAVGQFVRIGGIYSNNVLVAKVIESDDYDHQHDGGHIKLFGLATGVNAEARTFSIQGVTVTVPASLTLPTEGLYVEVVAELEDGVLTAKAIHTTATGASRPFEVFGLASCTNGASDLKTTFTLSLPIGSVAVDGSNAVIDRDHGTTLTPSTDPKTCRVEVKGTLSMVNSVKTITASLIEVKARY